MNPVLQPFSGRRAPRPHGFTLIELLMVLAVVGVLVTILFIAIGRARETARRATCLSNLRQIQAANMLHAADNKGYYVRIKFNNHWWIVQEEFIRYLNASKQTATAASSMVDALKCPEAEASGFLAGLSAQAEKDNFPGYGYSSYGVTASNGAFSALNQNAVATPAKTEAFTDALDFYYYKTPSATYKWDHEARTSVTRSYRHHDGGCVVYFDGHAEWRSRAQIEKK